MQIIGRNLPQLQNVVSSGLDSVTQGLVQNTSAVAAQRLAEIKDSFMAEGLNATNLNPASSIEPEAGFQNPTAYFNQAAPNLSEQFTAMSAALNDQSMRPESVIGNFAGSLKDLNSKIGSLADSPGTQQGIIIIGGRFQPNPPPIVPDGPPIEPIVSLPNPPPIRDLGPNPPPIRALSPEPPPIRNLSPDGPPIIPQSMLNNGDQRTALAIGGIFAPNPPPIAPDGPPIVPAKIMMPNPPPIDVFNQAAPTPPPIMPANVLGPDGPPIVPQILVPSPPPIAPGFSPIMPSPPPIRDLSPNPPPIDVLSPTPPPIIEMPAPPPIMPEAVLGPQPPPIKIGADQLGPSPPPIKIGDQLLPSPPPIMPSDILQSQLQALRDMETTVQQSTNMYQQLNSSMFTGRI